MDAFIVKANYGIPILKGAKTLELRSRPTTKRGTVGVIFSGTKRVYGTVDIVDCIEVSAEDIDLCKNKTLLYSNSEDYIHKRNFFWVLKNPVKFTNSVEYTHRSGCVVWVKLDDTVVENVYNEIIGR